MTTPAADSSFCFDCADSRGSKVLTPPSLNPWPMLIRADQLGHLRCQPLVRLVYSPRPLPQLLALLQDQQFTAVPDTPAARNAFRDRIRVMHEYVHFFVLDRTPAKELARAHLAYAYDLIGLLTRGERPSDTAIRQIWDSFRGANIRLSQTIVKIGLVEELLATAFALAMTESDVQPGRVHERFRPVYEEAAEEIVAEHERKLAGFTQLYEKVKPLIAGMAGNASVFTTAMSLLQPVQWQDDDLVAVDAVTQLAELVDALSEVETLDAAEKILQDRRETYDSGWRLALALQKENAANPEIVDGNLRIRYGFVADVLLSIARGDLVYDRTASSQQPTDFAFDVGPTGLVLLSLGRYRRRSVLERMTFFTRDADDTPELRARLWGLAHFEAMRQQLITREGIVCPENLRGLRRCQCSPHVRAALHRLADLAAAGYFGPGDWVRPTCRA